MLYKKHKAQTLQKIVNIIYFSRKESYPYSPEKAIPTFFTEKTKYYSRIPKRSIFILFNIYGSHNVKLL